MLDYITISVYWYNYIYDNYAVNSSELYLPPSLL